jgi:glycerol kinase
MLDISTGIAPIAPPRGFVPLIGWRLKDAAKSVYIIEGQEYAGGSLIDALVK